MFGGRCVAHWMDEDVRQRDLAVAESKETSRALHRLVKLARPGEVVTEERVHSVLVYQGMSVSGARRAAPMAMRWLLRMQTKDCPAPRLRWNHLAQSWRPVDALWGGA